MVNNKNDDHKSLREMVMSDNEATSYNAVEKNGVITAIWEMKGRKHVRTIDPRSEEGKRLLSNYQPGQGQGENKSETAHS
jgi:hypothetical protein